MKHPLDYAFLTYWRTADRMIRAAARGRMFKSLLWKIALITLSTCLAPFARS